MEFRLSMAFVVYMTRRVSEENLKIGGDYPRFCVNHEEVVEYI